MFDLSGWIMMMILFEINIVVDELTKDVSLVVFDFAEEDEVEEEKCSGKSNF